MKSVHHELKVWPQFYLRVAEGSKTFEIRNNDRGFQPGDTVALCEWDPTPDPEKAREPYQGEKPAKGYTNNPWLHFRIGYTMPIDGNRIIFSLLPMGAT